MTICQTFKLEHTVVTTGERIENTLKKFKNTDKKNLSQTAFNFNADHGAKSGAKAERISVDYFTLNKPYFEYNKQTMRYDRFQHGKQHFDAEYNKGVSVKNVIILEMPFEPVKNDPLHIVEVQTTGKGKGKYFCEGEYIDIQWSKKAYNEPLILTDKEGKTLNICPGNTFMCVIKTDGKLTIS